MAPGDGSPSGDAPPTAFERTTAVAALGDGRYGCDLEPGWQTVAGISGGILLAILVRAIAAEHPERNLRSLQCTYLRPPKPGAAQVEVETIRSGRRATNLRVRLTQDDRLLLEGLATIFAGELHELASWAPAPPDVPAAADVPARELDPRMPPIADHLAYRPCIGPPPLSGTPLEPGEPARTGGWLDVREPTRVDAALLAFFVDAWWPAALGPLDVISLNPTIDLTFHVRATLPPDGLPPQPLLLDLLTAASAEGLVDEDARIFTSEGTLLVQSRQLAITFTPDDRPIVPRAQ